MPTNRDSFLSRVQSDAGVALRLLSGEQEGYYGALGAINGVGLADGFVVDMGGGSVQVVEVTGGLPGRAASVQLGALHVAENYLGFDAAKPGAVKRLSQQVRELLAGQFDWFKAREGATLVGIGGTVRNLAAIAQDEDGYPLDSVDNYVLSGAHVHELGDRLWRLKAEERGQDQRAARRPGRYHPCRRARLQPPAGAQRFRRRSRLAGKACARDSFTKSSWPGSRSR